VTWTGDADVDLMIKEPAGTVCSLQNPRTTSGGVMLGDAYANGSDVNGFTETYICPQGFNGRYEMLVHRVWGDVTAGKVTVDIYTQNSAAPHIHRQIELSDKDAVVLFDVENGRRVQPLAHQQLANLQREREEQNRAMVARQLSRYEDSLAERDFKQARAAQRDFFRGGPAGFRPEITTLQEGTTLMATAVVSADRRYVRITPMPTFSFIGEVNTFNFGTGQTNTVPDDDDDDNNNNNGGDNGNNN
jgi:hypothetical protein